jgi:hypothetical protein
LLVEFLLKGTEEMIPNHKYTDVIPIEIDIVLGVMDAMIGGGLNPTVEHSHAPDHLRMRPELVEQLTHAHHQEHE